MKKYLMALMVLIVLVYTPNAHALAVCGCDEKGTAVEAASRAESVFLGTVTRIKSRGSKYEVYFTVDKIWKGNQNKFLKVETDRGDAFGTITYGVSCDSYIFDEGARYLVYTYRDRLSPEKVSRCSRTQKAEAAASDIVELGNPVYDFTVVPVTHEEPTLEKKFFGEPLEKKDADEDLFKLEH
ncbi:MAG: hypothetical protein EB060_04275 [Proteobacteria bacterium]|nr:hypothetical protein [Pseudomonadota bacterium]